MQRKWSTLGLAALALAASAASAGAQETKKPEDRERQVREEVFVRQAETFRYEAQGIGRGPKGDTFTFISSEMSVNGKVVKGSPYSAEAVTESVQTLADGNRIVRKNTAQLYRDSEGRTRREQTLNLIGAYTPAGEAPRTVMIHDPVSGVSYSLNPRDRTARKLTVVRVDGVKLPGPAQGGAAQGGTDAQRRALESAEHKRVLEQGFVYQTAPMLPGAVGVGVGGGSNVYFYSGHADNRETKTESLGTQVVEGVAAEGTRTTITIPAGQIGNEQPIEIVNERWYSNELQAVVKTVSSDPRTGTTTYRLTNIQRSEPSGTLFQVPSDYTVQEGPAVFGTGPRVRTFKRGTVNGTVKENE
jgi:hypothetical protein